MFPADTHALIFDSDLHIFPDSRQMSSCVPGEIARRRYR
jgi:hypothetical protein